MLVTENADFIHLKLYNYTIKCAQSEGISVLCESEISKKPLYSQYSDLRLPAVYLYSYLWDPVP